MRLESFGSFFGHKSEENLYLGHIEDLFNLPNSSRLRLTEQIKGSGGSLDILVHPYYVDAYYPPSKSYEDLRDSILQEGYRGLRPLVIFESVLDTNTLAGRLSRLGDGKLVTVKTVPDDPDPLVDSRQLQSREPFKIQAWNKLNLQLFNLGVSHVTVGGRLLFMRNTARDVPSGVVDLDQLSSRGCVGKTILELMKNFDVSISSVSSPMIST